MKRINIRTRRKEKKRILEYNYLHVCRNAFYLAEQEREGGYAPHTSPFTRVSDVGNLISAARMALPTIDTEEVKVVYSDMYTLLDDLQGMGENNAVVHRREYLDFLYHLFLSSCFVLFYFIFYFYFILYFILYFISFDDISTLPRKTIAAASAIYHHLYSSREMGGIPATFQIVYMIGKREGGRGRGREGDEEVRKKKESCERQER